MASIQVPASIEISAPAKLNLFLEVIGLRPDGYHELESVFQAISIYDSLIVKAVPTPGIRIKTDRSDLDNPQNLAVKAAEAFVLRLDLGCGIDIRLEKRIPVGAGLGGGSSDAAAVLVALNEMAGFPLSAGELREIGAGVGSDVPFFIEGGTALVGGRGERVEHGELASKLYFVVLFPGFGMSTAAVYKNLRLKLTCQRASAKVLWGSLLKDKTDIAERHLFNRLDEAAYLLDDRLGRARDLMAGVTGSAVLLSGSGSSLFSMFADRDRASEAARAVRKTVNGELFLAESVGRRSPRLNPEGDNRGNL